MSSELRRTAVFPHKDAPALQLIQVLTHRDLRNSQLLRKDGCVRFAFSRYFLN